MTLEEYITENGRATTVGLDTAVALGCRIPSSCIVDVFTRHNGLVRIDSHGEVRESGRAGESVSTLGVVKGGPLDSPVVVGDNGIGYEDEGGSGISDAVYTGGFE